MTATSVRRARPRRAAAPARAEAPAAPAAQPIWRRAGISLETLLYAAFFLAAVLTRFWDLGRRALHHDESLHAQFSWLLAVGRGYVHDPLMHGPFLFHANALAYLLFGANDATSRIMPALTGCLLVLVPYLLRPAIGRWGALIASFLLLISPGFLYYSRFIRHDIYTATATLLLFAAIIRYIDDRRPRWVYLGAVAFIWAFSNHEITYAIAFIFVDLPGRHRHLAAVDQAGGRRRRGARRHGPDRAGAAAAARLAEAAADPLGEADPGGDLRLPGRRADQSADRGAADRGRRRPGRRRRSSCAASLAGAPPSCRVARPTSRSRASSTCSSAASSPARSRHALYALLKDQRTLWGAIGWPPRSSSSSTRRSSPTCRASCPACSARSATGSASTTSGAASSPGSTTCCCCRSTS